MNTVEEVKNYLQSLVKNFNCKFLGINDLPEEFVVEEEGDWINDGKYDFCSIVYKHDPTNTYWEITNSRSGSYYTDYYYSTIAFRQVKPTEVTTTIWVTV